MGHWNAENVRRLRKQHGLTQEDVAEAVGVERKAVMAWESDTGREPRLGQAVALAGLFQVPLDDLMHDDDPATSIEIRGHGAPEIHQAPLASSARESANGAR